MREGEGVYTSIQYLLKGQLNHEDVEKIATGLLCNTLIQRYLIFDYAACKSGQAKPLGIPKVTGDARPVVREINLDVSDDQLVAISRDGVLALSLEEMKIIQAHFLREEVAADR
jgi:hypothetical protein